jgi:hypothetical protein
MRIHFVARDLTTAWPDLGDLRERDVAVQAARFRGGVNNWIVQTFLRLRESLEAAGLTPTIGENFIPDCVNVAHRDCLNRVFAPYYRSYVVGIRADRSPVHLCNLEVVQNELEVESPRVQFQNFWPQPGLIPRNPGRGTRIERVAYFGRTDTAPAWFYDPGWHAALADMGVVFEIRDDRWFDYSDVDIVLAHRTETPTVLKQKPASKLTNAWLAGVPALLADEPAYANLRRHGLDYITINSADDVVAVLRHLRSAPSQYTAMVDNGRRRSVDYSVAATKARWMRLLVDVAMPGALAWHAEHVAVEARLGQLARAARQKMAAKRFKLWVFLESRARARREVIVSSGIPGWPREVGYRRDELRPLTMLDDSRRGDLAA